MKKRTLALGLAVVMAASLLAGCGRAKNAAPAVGYSSRSAGTYALAENVPMAAMEEAYEIEADAYWADDAVEAPVPAPQAPAAVSGSQESRDPAKLIYTASLDMETLAFDQAVAALNELTAELGGYYESSAVSDQGACRWASYTVRVPSDQYRAFLDRAGDQCHVLSLREYTEDVSEYYYDTAGRLETQRTKLARLQEFLANARTMEDIIALENEISDTEETIDRLSGQLRHYDSLVDYSTIDISLEEVKVYEPEPDPTFGSRLGAAFTDGLRGFAAGLGDILVALAYCWLWLVLLAAAAVLVLWLTRKSRARRRQERAEREAQREARKNEPVSYSTPSEGTEPEK